MSSCRNITTTTATAVAAGFANQRASFHPCWRRGTLVNIDVAIVQHHIQHTLVGIELERGAAAPIAGTLINGVLGVAIAGILFQRAIAHTQPLTVGFKTKWPAECNKLSA